MPPERPRARPHPRTPVLRRALAAVAGTVLVAVLALATAPSSAAASGSAGSLSGTVLGPVSCASAGGPFPDVASSNIHCDNIWWLAGQRITKPADGRYHPRSSVSRGAMTAFLFRLTHPGKPSPGCTSRPYDDVPTGSTFCGYIHWAKTNGIAYGYQSGARRGSFGPDNAVTRGAMAAFLHRIAEPGVPGGSCTVKPYRDVPTDEMFCGVITWMKAHQITYGVGGGRYGTGEPVTRQSMASFLRRIVQRTDAAPGIGHAELGPLGGVWVVATAQGGRRHYVAKTGADGSYVMRGVAPGAYRVCFEASGTTSGVRAGYLDACHGDVGWSWKDPLPPSQARLVTVKAGHRTGGASAVLTPARKAAVPGGFGHRDGHVPKLAKKSSAYRFLEYSGDDPRRHPTTYNACRAIHYVVNPLKAPPGAAAIVTEAVQRVAAAAGLRFVYDGTTTERSTDTRLSRASGERYYAPQRDGNVYQPQRYGDRWAPVLISWQSATMNPRSFVDGAVGWGGSQAWWTSGSALSYVTGTITLDGPRLGQMIAQGGAAGRAEVRAVVMHELGHVVGLAHVTNSSELMYAYTTGDVTEFAAGDLTGLHMLGSAACVVPPVPGESAARALQLAPPQQPPLPAATRHRGSPGDGADAVTGPAVAHAPTLFTEVHMSIG